MQSEFGLWIYNIVVSKEFISSICGGAIAGATSLLVAKLTLRSEFNNQRKLEKLQKQKLEKSAHLMIKDELERNKITIGGYNTYYQVNNSITSIPIGLTNVGRPEDFAWKEMRSTIYLNNNQELINELSRHYRTIFAMKTGEYISTNTPNDVLIQIDKIINMINKII